MFSRVSWVLLINNILQTRIILDGCEVAGLRHGDLEPRNVLRSITGQLKLVDISEASEHQCYWRVVSLS